MLDECAWSVGTGQVPVHFSQTRNEIFPGSGNLCSSVGSGNFPGRADLRNATVPYNHGLAFDDRSLSIGMTLTFSNAITWPRA